MTRLFVAMLLALALFVPAQAKAALTLSYATETLTLAPNAGDLVQPSCPAGTKLVSGGWDFNSSFGPQLAVWVSRQFGNSWRVMAKNTSPTTSATFTGYAVCASGVAGLTTYSTGITGVNVPAFTGQSISPNCTNGGKPTGGGFDSNYPKPSDLLAHGSYPNFGNVWTISEYNSTNTAKSFSGFVTCANFNGSVTPYFGNTVNFGNGASALLTVECNFGDFAIGGGYYTWASDDTTTTVQKVRVTTNRPNTANTRRWLVRAYNGNAFSQAQVIPYAQCLHLT